MITSYEAFQCHRHTSRDRRYAIFINAFKAPGILNNYRDIKAHSILIMRCVKNVPITLTDVKRFENLKKKNDSFPFKILRTNKNENHRNFFQSHDTYRAIRSYTYLLNKARGILNNYRHLKAHDNLIMHCVSAEGYKYFSIFLFPSQTTRIDDGAQQIARD